MGICSSVLLLSPIPIEEKIDILFEWMCFNEQNRIYFDEFYLSLLSFEEGISHALGKQKSKEESVKELALRWFSLFSKGEQGKSSSIVHHGGDISENLHFINKDQFFELCQINYAFCYSQD